MEIREFAERVLFATTLKEKLAPPAGELTDVRPGAAVAAPAMPGRPAELRFKPSGVRQAETFPGLRELERAPGRGRLLHFFANHELLATELMALVLLRFPDAPAAFRRGVVRTLQEEQEHTRLYLARMRECGVTFGEQPVSGYFWRCVSGMENPMDYVAGLSLTFEQANLDFARHFAQGFARVGDVDTSRLLEKIYHDEIGHVAYGLRWFRRWKRPGESDWDAFCRQLRFPLSPQRAKGPVVNVAGRRAAGLDAEFIAQLEVYARSRGRTPSVFVFNPFAEAHIAQGRAFTPNDSQRAVAADLAILPMYLARRDDIVLVPRRPQVPFLRELQRAGFTLPEFVEEAEALATRKLGRLRPWAWSPDSVALFAPLFPQVTAAPRSAGEAFSPELAALYGKAWSAAFLRRFLQHQREAWLAPDHVAGVVARTADEALVAVAAIRRRGHHRIVVKQSLGLAGRNAIRLWEPQITSAQRRWIEHACQGGAEVVVEPWLERVVDFSMQVEMTARGLELVGFTGLETDLAGRFRANRAGPRPANRPPAGVLACFPRVPDIGRRLEACFARVRSELGTELQRVGYRGPVGVDAFVYRDCGGTCRLKPVVEINPRHTMGRLTLDLMRMVAPGCTGEFRIVNRAALRAAGAGDFTSYAEALCRRHPVQRQGNPVPRLSHGAIVLTDPAAAHTCIATFMVRGREHREERRGV